MKKRTRKKKDRPGSCRAAECRLLLFCLTLAFVVSLLKEGSQLIKGWKDRYVDGSINRLTRYDLKATRFSPTIPSD